MKASIKFSNDKNRKFIREVSWEQIIVLMV